MRVLPAHSEPVSTVQFSPDGTLLVSGSWDGYMCVPSPREPSLIADRFSPLPAGFGIPRPASVFEHSQTRTTHLCASHPFLSSLQLVADLPLSVLSANVRFSPNAKLLFASTLDSTIRLWDYQTDKVAKTYTGHTNRKCVDVSKRFSS
jgi:COMPASS component SWD3